MKEEQKKLKEIATFKARPNKVTQKEPFQPIKEDRPAVGKMFRFCDSPTWGLNEEEVAEN